MRRWFQRIQHVVLFVLVSVTPVMAQLVEEEKKARWVLPYALVTLLFGLSLYSICRPSARRTK